MPEELREELGEALVTLDAERIGVLIRRISEVDATLGGTLAVLASRFAYSPILRALHAGKGKPSKGV